MGFGIQKNMGDDVNITLQAMQETQADENVELRAEQKTSELNMQEGLKESVNPFAAQRKNEKKLETNKGRVKGSLEAGEKPSQLLPVAALKDMAGQFQRRNPELKADTLVLLAQTIKPEDTKEELLRKIADFYPDISLRDEALEYLLEVTTGDLARKLGEIKEELNQNFEREIVAGRNIHIQAREAAAKELGTPTSMRDMYRDVTGNPRDAPTLFDELAAKYGYIELKKVVDFLLHSMGADMNSKGPSIERAELQRLFSEVRNMQAIMGVYRFFNSRMKLTQYLFEENNLKSPPELTFESMAKAFMALAGERYPSADKVQQKASTLGLETTNVPGKIITFSQFRDAIREVALGKVYKTVQHRDDLYLAILEALEDLEDEMENLQDKEEDDMDIEEEPQVEKG
jgi:type III secretion protein W